jgi:hypothetical protein
MAEGREPIREREYGNRMQTNREPSGRLLLPCLVTSALKMETACFSETSAPTCKYTWHQNPRPLQHDNNCCENLKSHRCYKKIYIYL